MTPMRRTLRCVVAVVAATAAASAVPTTAGAAPDTSQDPPTATAKQVQTGEPAARAVCGEPGKNQATCLARRRTDVSGVHGLMVTPNAAPAGYGPTDLRDAYNIPADGGAGQTIAIVDAYVDPTAESDLALYRQQFRLPPCTTDNGCFRKVDQRGGTAYPPADPGWAGKSPSTWTWSRRSRPARTSCSSPEPVAYEACGAIDGELYCAGGTTSRGQLQHAYAYDPGSDTWSRIADLPIALSGAGYTAANGRLMVSGGITSNSSTTITQGFAYDPATNAWTGMPTALATGNRGGSSLGFYRVGGQPALGAAPSRTAQVLPGYDQDDTADVPWLTESVTQVTLAPGETVRVTVTLSAKAPAVLRAGTYSALLIPASDTPYTMTPIPVSLQVK